MTVTLVHLEEGDDNIVMNADKRGAKNSSPKARFAPLSSGANAQSKDQGGKKEKKPFLNLDVK
jgi:hypothetical protein